MSTMTLSAKGGGDFFRLRFWAAALLMLGMFLMLGIGQANAAPLAGTSIGNQASATYTDANSVSRITVSNSVSTVVAQVSNASLTQSQTKTGAPGSPITFPHTITNNGNGPESYTINDAFTTVGNSLSALPALYADANCDGVADNSTNLAGTNVGPVAPGAQFCFVAQGTLNTSATTNSVFNVTAVSTLTGTPTATGSPNSDTAVISNNGVITVSKSVDKSFGPAGTTVVYTLTYRNTGTQTATGVVLADQLQSGVSVTATIGGLSPVWSGGTVSSLNAINGTTPNRINVSVQAASGVQRVVAVIESVAPNTQGTFSFTALENGAGPTNNNNAQFCYRDGVSTVLAAVATQCDNIINGSGVTTGATSGTYNTAGGILDTNAPTITGATNTNSSNTVPFTIATTSATGALVINNGVTTGGGGNGIAVAGNVTATQDGANPTTTGTATANDTVTVAAAPQGSVVSFSNWVWNTGTASDAFNVSATANNFPAGTSFLLLRADGVTPLTDSDGDGVLDTGPIPGTGSGYSCPAVTVATPNATASSTTPCGYRIVVRAILPSNASAGGPYDVIITAKSSLTPATTNTVQDRLTTITGSLVDLRNPRTVSGDYSAGALSPAQGTASTYVTGGGTGQQAAGEPGAVTTINANPSTQVRFKLDVVNTGTVADSFDLAYNVGSGGWSTLPGFTTPGAVSSGFQVRFYFDGGSNDCSTVVNGQQVSNTGVLQPVASAPANRKLVCAQVDIPAGATAGAIDFYFRAASPTTATATTGSSADVKHDQLVINTARSVTITPNNSGQVFPGGSIAYCHTVTNAGNVNETSIALQNANSQGSPWPTAATVYRDTNNNCVLDAGETTPLTNPSAAFSLNAGVSQNFIVVVQAPNSATAGQTNVTTITATPSGTINTVAAPAAVNATDSTVVVVGQVTLAKTQAMDTSGTACSMAMTTAGVGSLTFSASPIQQSNVPPPIPGACIVYHVVATNIGTQNVTGVVINDTSPPNTTCQGTPFSTTPASVTVTTPSGSCGGGQAATINAAITTPAAGTLAPNATFDVYFRVKINP